MARALGKEHTLAEERRSAGPPLSVRSRPVTALVFLLERIPEFAALSFLALIQGLTEFLPVSSSGHLVISQKALGLDEPALTIDVALHLGTLLAVFVVYRADLVTLLRDVLAGRLREVAVLAVASVPAAVVGLAGRRYLASAFEETSWAAWGLLATAGILLVGEKARRSRSAGAAPEETSEAAPGKSPGFGVALLIGGAQALAIWPGISRSGATIAVGLVCGLSPARAARFSFLLSIIVIVGAAAFELPNALGGGAEGSAAPILWAALFAGFVGWGALRLLLAFLGRGAFAWFAVYCAALGGGVLLFG